MTRLRAAVKWAAISVVPMLLLIQLVPYGRDHSNPATGTEKRDLIRGLQATFGSRGGP